MLIANYKKIVKNIVRSLRNGNITTKNSDKLQSYSAAALYALFANAFDFQVKTYESVCEYNRNTNTLTIPLPMPALAINSMYFTNVGDAIDVAFEGPSLDIRYSTLNTGIDPAIITTCFVTYVVYSKFIVEVIDNIALGLE